MDGSNAFERGVTMSNGVEGGVAALRESALHGLRTGDVAAAEQSFARLLEQVPDDVEALQFLAANRLMRGMRWGPWPCSSGR